jgi:hypothetical protein
MSYQCRFRVNAVCLFCSILNYAPCPAARPLRVAREEVALAARRLAEALRGRRHRVALLLARSVCDSARSAQSQRRGARRAAVCRAIDRGMSLFVLHSTLFSA